VNHIWEAFVGDFEGHALRKNKNDFLANLLPRSVESTVRWQGRDSFWASFLLITHARTHTCTHARRRIHAAFTQCISCSRLT